ncbi:DUF6397 family protein, partial [Streptomyces cadmiisoli]|uniref:DUF6397 family protein n=1 Tax=Streptomyces cadmiisoli TaxID=2184053 RepID=UPI00364B8F4D
MTQMGTALRDDVADGAADVLVGGAQAAGELGLSRGEFARAVQLGIVRAGPRTLGGAARYARAELDRVRTAAGPLGELR